MVRKETSIISQSDNNWHEAKNVFVGEVRTGMDALPFRFTGKTLDEETGLYYFGAMNLFVFLLN
jgi:hypothetical protein